MQHGDESSPQPSVTHCVAVSADAGTRNAIGAWAAKRGWLCQVESNPYLAWARMLLIEKSNADRTRWGLQSAGRSVLLIDDRGCDDATLRQLKRACARYIPNGAHIVLHDGALPHVTHEDSPEEPSADPGDRTPLPSTSFADGEPSRQDDDDEDDALLTPEEIRMLLGDDSMEPVP